MSNAGEKIFIADKETLDKVYNILSTEPVYGFIEHMDVLAPDERIEYIGLNKDYVPLTVNKTTHAASYGGWSAFPVLTENKPWMVKSNGSPDYELSETDYTKKSDGTTASDVSNASYDGGAFSKLIRIWRKVEVVGHDRVVKFSLTPREGFTDDGFNGVPYRWIPMFYASVADNKAQCIAGTQPSYNLSTDAQHNAITAFHTNAKFFGGPIVEVVIDLLMMFSKTSNLQDAYGNGNMSGYDSSASPTYGVKANAVVGGGQFYGSSDGTSLNKILHSIVLGTYQQWMRDPYEVVVNGVVKVSKDYTYDPTGAAYVDTGIRVSDSRGNTWRYPLQYLVVDGYGSIPDQSSAEGSTETGPCDGTYNSKSQSTMTAVLLRFGSCNAGAPGGSRARIWDDTAADANWSIGFAVFL